MSAIFKLKTDDAYSLKILSELLTSNLKTGCFTINKDEMKLCMVDSHSRLIIHTVLNSANFTLYRYKNDDDMNFGITMGHLNKMFITKDKPDDLAIKVIPKDCTRITTSYIKIQDIQLIIPDEIPSGYKNSFVIHSAEFQKMAKEMVSMGKITTITTTSSIIRFTCGTEGLLKRSVEFGESPDDEDSDDEEEMYKQTFDTEQLSRISKVSGLSGRLHVYTSPDKPIMFKSNVGTLGFISIYIKSIEMLDKEHLKYQQVGSEESDSDSEYFSKSIF